MASRCADEVEVGGHLNNTLDVRQQEARRTCEKSVDGGCISLCRHIEQIESLWAACVLVGCQPAECGRDMKRAVSVR